jgi:hypothetical protein
LLKAIRSEKLRGAKEFMSSALVLAMLGFTAAQSLVADQASYSDNPSNYAKTAMVLEEMFGSSDPTAGVFTETYPPSFVVNGTGMQDVTFNFLYEDGGYTFEFGYFILTDELLGMGTDTAAEKEAWAEEALSTAQTLIVDKKYSASIPAGAFEAVPDPTWEDNPDDPDDYMGVRSAVNSRTISLMGGTRIEFFIIPNNTLANFQNNPDSISLTGSSTQAWPLFSYNAANPGTGSGGSGEGVDQVMTFDGTTEEDFFDNDIETGTVDIRRLGTASDNDFSDLIFFIGNVLSETPVPGPTTVFAGIIFLSLVLGIRLLHRKGRPLEQ